MEHDNCQKIKLLKLMEILRQETDEKHPLMTSELCQRLIAMGISCNPRTLGRDIMLLNKQGYEILHRIKNRENAYYLVDRSFSVPELKILIDAVQAASFVPDKKTAELIDKIAELGGSHRGALLKSNLVKFNTRKHTNETVFSTVDYLEEALQNNRQVAFKYFDLDENGQCVFRKDGEQYIIEPIALVFNDDNYYLLGYDPELEMEKTFRVDRIDSAEILKKATSKLARAHKRKVAKYTEETFKMFDGEQETVTLRFDDKLVGVVHDKFGESVKMKRIDDNTIETEVKVRIAPTFWGWLFQFGGMMKIVDPDTINEEFKKQVAAMLRE